MTASGAPLGSQELLQAAVDHLRAGGLVAAATESFFALMADAANSAALDRLFAVKGRETSKGVALMLGSADEWSAWVGPVPPAAAEVGRRFWPGPLTLALPALPHVDARLTVDGTVGVRVPGESLALEVARAYGRALTGTSANLSGEPPARTSDELSAALRCRAELLVLPGAAPGGAPSTIATYELGTQRLRVQREGAIPTTELAAWL